MSRYEVWGTNDPVEWTFCLLETDDREKAKQAAANALDGKRFRFVAIDRDGRTIWSNDPDTPASD